MSFNQKYIAPKLRMVWADERAKVAHDDARNAGDGTPMNDCSDVANVSTVEVDDVRILATVLVVLVRET